jgi:uncharacterized protein (DUF2235 family)
MDTPKMTKAMMAKEVKMIKEKHAEMLKNDLDMLKQDMMPKKEMKARVMKNVGEMMPRMVKGSPEAKAYMAKLRAMRK